MLRRKAYDRLLEWKKQSRKKALCIMGARQIGKTTIIREFARENYDHFIELNFILQPEARMVFAGSLDANTIITNLSAFAREPMEPGRTLILLDEIQMCPNARTAIKFLVEDGRFDYIESGSLLGVRHKEVRSYPVGFEEPYRMYPMDFEEYLWANGRHLRYANSFEWLSDTGMALPCYNITAPEAPLQLNEKHNLFKLFLSDVGLLCAACMENVQFGILQGDLEINMGSILENVMAQQLLSNGLKLYYFDSKKYGELDFVLQNGLRIQLMEVKSGGDYKKHAALDKVRRVEEWKLDRSYVFCKGNVEVDDGVTYLPWYLVMFLKPEELPRELIYQVDISGL